MARYCANCGIEKAQHKPPDEGVYLRNGIPTLPPERGKRCRGWMPEKEQDLFWCPQHGFIRTTWGHWVRSKHVQIGCKGRFKHGSMAS